MVRVGVIGCGHLGRFHARILRRLALEAGENRPPVQLTAVADPDERSVRELAAETNAAAYRDFRELLPHVDAVVLAAPTRHHRAIGVECLQAGRHLLVEKPLAARVDEAQALVDMARQRHVVLQVGHVERFNPAFEAAAPWLQAPKFIQAVRRGQFAGRSTDIGVVLDLMIHDLDLVLSLVQAPVVQIDALGAALLGRHEDLAHARLAFADGTVAVLEASRVSMTAERSMRLWSLQGQVELDFGERKAAILRPCEAILSQQFDVERLSPAERLLVKNRLLGDLFQREEIAVPAQDALTAELCDFLQAIAFQRSPRVTGEQGRDGVALAEQIINAIENHRWTADQQGPAGPQFLPPPRILPTPWETAAPARPLREAG